MPTQLEYNLSRALSEFESFFLNDSGTMQQRKKSGQRLQMLLKRYLDDIRHRPNQATSNIARPQILTNSSGIITAGGDVERAVKAIGDAAFKRNEQ